jgi:hypothetical protein
LFVFGAAPLEPVTCEAAILEALPFLPFAGQRPREANLLKDAEQHAVCLLGKWHNGISLSGPERCKKEGTTISGNLKAE